MSTNVQTRYAKRGGVHLAFQVRGGGPRDILAIPTGYVPIDCIDDEPSMARFHRRLAAMGRLIRYDASGVGLSDPAVNGLPSLDDWADDALAVLDAVESAEASVFVSVLHTPIGVTLAAKHPDRVKRLVIVNGLARVLHAPDYPAGVPESYFDETTASGTDPDDDGGLLELAAPSVAGDAAFRAWFDRAGNRGASPAMARAMFDVTKRFDVRSLLPTLGVPTLVLHRRDARLISVDHGRYLAEHLPDVRYHELPGEDTLYWVGDTDPMLDEIEEFLTGTRGAGDSGERVLATVLFTDIVESTDRIAELGDRGWRDLLDHHDRVVRRQIERFGGREVNTVGDGFVATFDSPRRAIECASAIRLAVGELGLAVRAGIHTGEIEVRGSDIAGMTVHIGARICALAGPEEVLVSSTLRSLVPGSAFAFEDRGDHTLKGVPEAWRISAVPLA